MLARLAGLLQEVADNFHDGTRDRRDDLSLIERVRRDRWFKQR